MVWMHGRSYYTRVYRAATDTEGAKVRLYTDDPEHAEDIERVLDRVRRRGADFDVLAAVADGILTAGQLAEAYWAGDRRFDRLRATMHVADLAPLVAEWDGRGRRGARSAKYVQQVRELIPEGAPFPATRFTTAEITRFLDERPVSDPTKNRYKAALVQFARWLLVRGLLASDPTEQLPHYAEHQPRMRWFTAAEAQRVVGAMTGEAQAVAALMALTGVEWSAVAAAHRSDLDLTALTFHARGSKHHPGRRNWRDRVVEILDPSEHPEWAWAWPLLVRFATSRLPAARLITMGEPQVLRHQQAACTVLQLAPHTLHDWRHTYAVHAIKRGDDDAAIRRQLGHAPNSIELYRVYGAYIDEARAARDRTGRRPAARNR